MPDFDPEISIPADWARMYRACGLQVVPSLAPNPDGQWKRPALANWKEFQNAMVPQPQFDRWYGKGGQYAQHWNMGWLTNVPDAQGRRAFLIDLDTYKTPAANQWWRGLLAVHNNNMGFWTPTIRTGGGGLQYIFYAPGPWIPPTIKTGIGVDIRGVGGFGVLPPSRHTSGGLYAYRDNLAPWETEIAEGPQWLYEAIDRLAQEHGGGASLGQTPRPEAQYPVSPSGKLLDGREDKMKSLVWARLVDLCRESPIPPGEQDMLDAYRAYSGAVKSRITDPDVDQDELLEREGRGLNLFRQKWRYAVDNKWDTDIAEAAKQPSPNAEAVRAAPEPYAVEVMDPETGEFLPALQEPTKSPVGPHPTPSAPMAENLPGAAPEPILNVFDPWEHYPVPDFPLDSLSPVMRDYVEVSARSTGGDINACAMVALAVAGAAIDQSFRLRMRKSGTWAVPPLLWLMLFGAPSTMKTPIVKQFLWALELIEAEAREAYRKAMADWKSAGKKADDPEPDKPLRYITADATVEKIGDILSRQDRGILLHKDEMSGWFGTLDASKNGREAEKSFFTKAFNGNRHSVDRIGRGEVFIANLAVPIIGGMQPDEMAKIPDLTSNGLMQRFLPVVMRPAQKGQEVDDDIAKPEWRYLIRRLTSLKPHEMIATSGAMEVFDRFQNRCKAMENVDGLGAKFTTFIGKLSGMHGSLALILHLIDGRWDQPVSEGAAGRAEQILTQFCMPHALAFYGLALASGDMDELRAVASYVLASDKERFTPSDFTANSRSLRKVSAGELVRCISPLVVNGWLEEEYGKGNGRVTAWSIRPGIRDALAARRAQQQEQRREIAALLAKMRRRPDRG